MPNTRAYRSKIGRLPFAVRNELCEQIRDGATGAEITAWLNRHPSFKAVRKATGCGELNAQNLTDWRTSGYQDWLKDQDKTDHLRKLAEFADAIAVKTGGDPSAVGSRIIAGRLLDILESAGEESVGELVKMFASLRTGENEAKKIVLAKEKMSLDRQSLDLARDRFRRDTCELFLKWHQDQRAAEIAAGPGTHDQKIAALLAYMDKEEKTA